MTDLKEICKEIENCNKCQLCTGRTNVVPGVGHERSKILFVGEGPGRDEDLQGKPFVGAAGKFLTELIESIGLARGDVFITNIVKCRPPDNRDPFPEEIDACWPYLIRQIKQIKPSVIVTLGRHSMHRFLPGLKISEVHGMPKVHKGIWSETQIYIPLYHPAVALYDPGKRKVLLEDFKSIPKVLKKLSLEKNGS